MKPGIIITARLNSTRLPGKVLMGLDGEAILSILLERLVDSCGAAEDFPIVVATPDSQIAKEVGQWCKRALEGYVFTSGGSEEDVFIRVLDCAIYFEIDPIIRITGDCPFVDGKLVLQCLQAFKSSNVELVGLACGDTVTNQPGNCYPEGVDCEVVSLAALQNFGDEQPGDREHVTQHVKRRGNFKLLRPNEDYRDVKLSIDTMEDYRQACLIAGRIGIHAGWKEIAECARWWTMQDRNSQAT